MWIHYIGEIMIGVTILLVAAHFGAHFYFKHKRRKNLAAKQNEHTS